jgi:type I restriction enzyme R subunit
MSKVGQKERATQNRVVKLFQQKLHYTYLGNWEDRYNNSNIEEEYLRLFLKRQGYSDSDSAYCGAGRRGVERLACRHRQ